MNFNLNRIRRPEIETLTPCDNSRAQESDFTSFLTTQSRKKNMNSLLSLAFSTSLFSPYLTVLIPFLYQDLHMTGNSCGLPYCNCLLILKTNRQTNKNTKNSSLTEKYLEVYFLQVNKVCILLCNHCFSFLSFLFILSILAGLVFCARHCTGHPVSNSE